MIQDDQNTKHCVLITKENANWESHHDLAFRTHDSEPVTLVCEAKFMHKGSSRQKQSVPTS